MSSCGLLFVLIYSSAAVFMIVDGRTKIGGGDAMDVSLLLQKALRVVEMQARTIDSLQAQISKCFNRKPPVHRSPRELKGGETSGVTYIRWGRLSCEDNGTTLLYKGNTAGRDNRRIGGGTNQLCLPEEPHLQNHTQPGVYSGWLYGIEYRTGSDKYRDGTTAYHGKPTPCAVCYVAQRSVQLMIPASNTCPVGWTREYDGYLMSEYSWPVGTNTYRHHSSSYICVDSAPEAATGANNQYRAFLYFTKVGCGTLSCSKFHDGWDVPCVVCTK